MTSFGWLLVGVAFCLGAIAGALALRTRASREVVARTLVPFRTRQIISVLQSGAMIVRTDRRHAYANPVAVALGVARPDGALHSGVADLAEKAWKERCPVEDEVEIRRGVLGTNSVVHVRVVPLDDELALALANDNTELHAAEKSRREFATNISHELKTPIGAMTLLAETLYEGSDDPELVRKFSRKMQREAKRLMRLVQEVIEISRLQSDASVVDYVPVNVSELIEDVMEASATAAQAKGVSVHTEIEGNPVALGDFALLSMAARNLLDNAISYSDPGKRITVSAKVNGELCQIAVIDQGIGIDAKDLDHIFERFYRADPARSRESGGTGLGLSIVKHIAAQHHGKVDVWSQAGVGSTFTITVNSHKEQA